MSHIRIPLLILLILALGTVLGCGPDSEVKELQIEVAALSEQIQSLQLNIGDLAAEAILGDWNGSRPRQVREAGEFRVLRDAVSNPGAGAAEQLNHALVRSANAGAISLIFRGAQFDSDLHQLEALNQCLEYLLATSNAPRSCNLSPISP